VGNTYKASQYFWLWVRCIGFSCATACAIAGVVSLLGETSVGAVLYANATRAWGVEAMNILVPQTVFISFISVLLAGVVWSTIFAVRKYTSKQKPSIYTSSIDQRLDMFEQKIEQRLDVFEQRITALEKKVGDNAYKG